MRRSIPFLALLVLGCGGSGSTDPVSSVSAYGDARLTPQAGYNGSSERALFLVSNVVSTDAVFSFRGSTEFLDDGSGRGVEFSLDAPNLAVGTARTFAATGSPVLRYAETESGRAWQSVSGSVKVTKRDGIRLTLRFAGVRLEPAAGTGAAGAVVLDGPFNADLPL